MSSRVRKPMLAVSVVAALSLVALTAIVLAHPFLPEDAAIEKDVQSVNVGPFLYVFGFYQAIGGPMGAVAEAIVFGIVLLLNRAAWRLLIAAALASGWYYVISHLVTRPRPAVPEVLRVTEHPGASSYPSGHMILFIFYAVTLMLCVGYRYLPRRWRPYGWAAAVVLVLIGGVSRMYSGAHWPSDVLAGALIAVAWLGLVVSIRSISDPVLAARERSHVPPVASAKPSPVA